MNRGRVAADWVRVACMVASLTCGGSAGAFVSTSFDSGADGWDVIDLPGVGDYANVLGTYAADWSSTGGNPGGRVSLFDPSSGAFFFRAPAVYLGDQSAAIGQPLSFDLYTNDNSYSADSVVVLVGGSPSKIIVAPIAQPAVDVWESYSTTLDAAGFRLNNAAGPVISAADFADVMGELQGLFLPGEFATGLVETTRLDNVTLLPEPAAIAAMMAMAVVCGRRSR